MKRRVLRSLTSCSRFLTPPAHSDTLLWRNCSCVSPPCESLHVRQREIPRGVHSRKRGMPTLIVQRSCSWAVKTPPGSDGNTDSKCVKLEERRNWGGLRGEGGPTVGICRYRGRFEKVGTQEGCSRHWPSERGGACTYTLKSGPKEENSYLTSVVDSGSYSFWVDLVLHEHEKGFRGHVNTHEVQSPTPNLWLFPVCSTCLLY